MGIRHRREQIFLDTIADKNKTYTYQPRWFYFADGSKYMPDFYCKEDDTYIEVVGTRQAYHQNRHKYKKFLTEFPSQKLQLVNVDLPFKEEVSSPKTRLQNYLVENDINQSEFAKLIGRTQQTVSEYCNGYKPPRDAAIKIVKATKGQVTLADLWGM